MIRLRHTLLLTSALACGMSGSALAAPLNIVPGENMVMLPMDAPHDESNMVSVPLEKAKKHPKKARTMTPKTVPVAAQPVAEDNMVTVDENMVMLPAFLAADDVGDGGYAPITGPNYVEAGVNFHSVSDKQGNWFGQFVNAQIQTDPKNRWNMQLQHQQAFHDNGVFAALGNTHFFDDRWFSDVAVGVGSDAVFLPRVRGDASISRRWLDGKNFVTTVGITGSKASETYTSYGVLLSASYYFNGPWVLQGGVRFEVSNPGSVNGNSEFLALTYGYQKRYFLTGRIGYANEGYQILGNGVSAINDFNSKNAGLNWRQWLGDDWGFNLGYEYYTNPFYHRNGGIVSVFKEF